ncbi:hypothetical protein ACLB2K_004003 [Fragaria x ananassa]
MCFVDKQLAVVKKGITEVEKKITDVELELGLAVNCLRFTWHLTVSNKRVMVFHFISLSDAQLQDSGIAALAWAVNCRYLRPWETKFLSVNLLRQFLSKGFFKSRSWNCWSNIGHQVEENQPYNRKQCTADVKWWQLNGLCSRSSTSSAVCPPAITSYGSTCRLMKRWRRGPSTWQCCSFQTRDSYVTGPQ